MAARLGKIEFYLTNPATGLPISGAVIQIRRQGAQIVSGGPTAFTIDNPGAIRHSSETGAPADDSCVCYKADGTVRDANVRGVTALTATSITMAAPGFTGTADDDRISPTTNLPTIYEDSEGTTAIASSQITTDANGFAACYAAGGAYDGVVISGATERILADVEARGADSHISNAWGTGAQTFFRYNTLRALASGDKLVEWLVQGASKVSINRDGLITVVGFASSAAGVISAGGLSVTGGITAATGNVAITAGNLTFAAAAAKIIPGATSLAIRNAADSADNLLIENAGDATLRQDFTLRRLRPSAGTAHVAGDWALSGGWGTTATASVASGCKDSGGLLQITANGAGIAANPTVTLTFKDGTWTVAPRGVASRTDGSAPAAGYWRNSGATATTIIWTFEGTPVAGTTYGLQYFHFTAGN